MRMDPLRIIAPTYTQMSKEPKDLELLHPLGRGQNLEMRAPTVLSWVLVNTLRFLVFTPLSDPSRDLQGFCKVRTSGCLSDSHPKA